MDGTSTSDQRDVERVFQVDRHSIDVLATAFERLSGDFKLSEHQRHSVHPTQDDSEKSEIQEARS